MTKKRKSFKSFKQTPGISPLTASLQASFADFFTLLGKNLPKQKVNLQLRIRPGKKPEKRARQHQQGHGKSFRLVPPKMSINNYRVGDAVGLTPDFHAIQWQVSPAGHMPHVSRPLLLQNPSELVTLQPQNRAGRDRGRSPAGTTVDWWTGSCHSSIKAHLNIENTADSAGKPQQDLHTIALSQPDPR